MKDLIFFDFMNAFHTQLRPFTINSSQFILEQAIQLFSFNYFILSINSEPFICYFKSIISSK